MMINQDNNVKRISRVIQAELPDALVYVIDPQSDGQHFQAVVVSVLFEGMSLVKQHQKVMHSLKKDFDSELVHALSLKTFTPIQWENQKNKYLHFI